MSSSIVVPLMILVLLSIRGFIWILIRAYIFVLDIWDWVEEQVEEIWRGIQP